MQAPVAKIVLLTMAAVLALGSIDAAQARHKKHRAAPVHRVMQDPAAGITRDEYGNPIIMQGFRVPHYMPSEQQLEPGQRHVVIPRGSSTYIPPPVPSPYSSNSPPAPGVLQPGPGVYTPPPVNSFSDRVTNCIMSAPFNAGVGNNPAGRDAYVRSCAN